MSSFLAVAALAGCSAEFWKGRPDVDRVDVSVADIVAEGETVQATAIPRKDDGTAITSNEVSVTFSSSDPNVATIGAKDGRVVGMSPGIAVITAQSQNKTGTDTVRVVEAPPASIVSLPEVLTPIAGSTIAFTVEPRKANGQPLGNRSADFSTSDPRIATVTKTGALTATVVGVAPGSAAVVVVINGVRKDVPVSVRQTPIDTLIATLQNGSAGVQMGEAIQIVVAARDAAGRVVSTAGRDIRYTSSDQTVASVGPTNGVVTGVREGETTVTLSLDGVEMTRLTVRVIPRRVTDLAFTARSVVFRVGGGVRQVQAAAVDSNGVAVSRQITYSSTNTSVATVSSSGLITPRAIGSTKIVAALEELRDTLDVRVTPIPITSVVITPTQANITFGQTAQFMARLFDSTGVEVTGRTVSWQTTNSEVATIDPNGLATPNRQPGSVSVQAIVDRVPGFADRIVVAVELNVRLVPIHRIEVTPASVSLRVGGRTFVTIRAFDASGRELFGRNNSIVARVEDPTVASADAAGTINGLKAGTTRITYQAINAAGLSEGDPVTIAVDVTTQ